MRNKTQSMQYRWDLKAFNMNLFDLANVVYQGTLISADAGGAGAIYFSFISRSFAVRSGNAELKPGTRPSTQINSFSIQLRSWLLQTEIMNTVCQKSNQPRDNSEGFKVKSSIQHQLYQININFNSWFPLPHLHLKHL